MSRRKSAQQPALPTGHTSVMAARDHTADDVEFFPTPPWGARAGAELVKRIDPIARSAWDPCCGAGHMVHGLRDYFRSVRASDAYRYTPDHELLDFVSPSADVGPIADWLFFNPPFALSADFVRLGLQRARRGVAMLMRTGFLESETRFELLYGAHPLTYFAPFSERLPMHKGRYEQDGSTATFYGWFIWKKGVRLLQPRGAFEAPGAWTGVPIPPGTRARLTRDSDRQYAMVDDDDASGARTGTLL